MKARVLSLSVLLLAPAAADQDQQDLYWPEYKAMAKPSDPTLDCTQLQALIDKTAADILVLDKTQHAAEDRVRAVYDTQSAEGREQAGAFLSTGVTRQGSQFLAARRAIMASKKIAGDRLVYLKNLLPSCKPAP